MERFSILESHWLNFTTVSCVVFTFSRKLPYGLDVFFVVRDGQIETVEDRANNGNGKQERQFTVHSLIGKVGD